MFHAIDLKRKKIIYAMSELESELEQKTILSSNDFKIPTKCVKAAQDILVWEKSDAYQVIEATLIVGIRPKSLHFLLNVNSLSHQ